MDEYFIDDFENRLLLAANQSSQFLLQVRSQSESAALNSLKVPRNLYHELEMCRQQMENVAAGGVAPNRYGKVSFYAPVHEPIQSDSEGDDSLVSSEEGGSSSPPEDHDDVDAEEADLGVVRDLDFDDLNISEHPQHRSPSPLHVLHSSSPLHFLANTAASSSVSTPVPNPPSPPIPSSRENSFDLDGKEEAIVVECKVAVEEKGQTSPQSQKKAVRFADECGCNLETIRVMTEPSDYPPKISPSVIRRYRKAAAASMGTGTTNGDDDEDDDEDASGSSKNLPRNSWQMGFKQPASEYVKFRDTLETQKVALENVMLKNEVGRMVGTVKVANIAFEKRVFIRFTADQWCSYMDRPAMYQSSPSKTYDTFRFDIELPRNVNKDSRIEFCVCLVANGCTSEPARQEHWDSNGGRNFSLISPQPEPPPPQQLQQQPKKAGDSFARNRITSLDYDDAYMFEQKDWTNFASWKQLSTQGPYW